MHKPEGREFQINRGSNSSKSEPRPCLKGRVDGIRDEPTLLKTRHTRRRAKKRTTLSDLALRKKTPKT